MKTQMISFDSAFKVLGNSSVIVSKDKNSRFHDLSPCKLQASSLSKPQQQFHVLHSFSIRDFFLGFCFHSLFWAATTTTATAGRLAHWILNFL